MIFDAISFNIGTTTPQLLALVASAANVRTEDELRQIVQHINVNTELFTKALTHANGVNSTVVFRAAVDSANTNNGRTLGAIGAVINNAATNSAMLLEVLKPYISPPNLNNVMLIDASLATIAAHPNANAAVLNGVATHAAIGAAARAAITARIQVLCAAGPVAQPDLLLMAGLANADDAALAAIVANANADRAVIDAVLAAGAVGPLAHAAITARIPVLCAAGPVAQADLVHMAGLVDADDAALAAIVANVGADRAVIDAVLAAGAVGVAAHAAITARIQVLCAAGAVAQPDLVHMAGLADADDAALAAIVANLGADKAVIDAVVAHDNFSVAALTALGLANLPLAIAGNLGLNDLKLSRILGLPGVDTVPEILDAISLHPLTTAAIKAEIDKKRDPNLKARQDYQANPSKEAMTALHDSMLSTGSTICCLAENFATTVGTMCDEQRKHACYSLAEKAAAVGDHAVIKQVVEARLADGSTTLKDLAAQTALASESSEAAPQAVTYLYTAIVNQAAVTNNHDVTRTVMEQAPDDARKAVVINNPSALVKAFPGL